MPTLRVARIVGHYQISLEGEAEKIESMIAEIDKLAEKIQKNNSHGKMVTISESAESQTAPPPAVPGATSAAEAVIRLFGTDWGTSRRFIREIKEALDANALFYPITSLSGVLAGLARQGKLRRWKESQGYVYVRGKISQ